MATINEKLQSIQNSKDAIKAAIIAKGGTCSDKLSEFASAVAGIPSEGNYVTFIENAQQTGITTDKNIDNYVEDNSTIPAVIDGLSSNIFIQSTNTVVIQYCPFFSLGFLIRAKINGQWSDWELGVISISAGPEVSGLPTIFNSIISNEYSGNDIPNIVVPIGNKNISCFELNAEKLSTWNTIYIPGKNRLYRYYRNGQWGNWEYEEE